MRDEYAFQNQKENDALPNRAGSGYARGPSRTLEHLYEQRIKMEAIVEAAERVRMHELADGFLHFGFVGRGFLCYAAVT